MAQAIAALDNLIKEELPMMITEAGPEIAPVFDKIKRTALGVKKQEGLGRGYEVIHLYETGTAGLIESGDPQGPQMETITGGMVQRLSQTTPHVASHLTIFPDAKDSPHMGDIKRKLTLHKVVGNFSIPPAWKQADLLNASQIKKVARDMKAVAKLKAIYEASSFFSHSATNTSSGVNQVLGRIKSIEQVTGAYGKITINEEYGRIANFRQGMRIDLVANDASGYICEGENALGEDVLNYEGGATSVYIKLLITGVDYLGKSINVKAINSSTGASVDFDLANTDAGDAFSVVPAEDDWITAAHTSRISNRPQLSWGLNDWIKGGATEYILGGSSANKAALYLGDYPQFKSQVKAVNGPLTDDVINGYIGGYLDAYPGETLDTVITTQGVQLKWLQQPGLYNNRQNYERTGKALSFKGGWSQISYEFAGRTYEWIMSPMCLSKTLYAMKFGGDNIQRFSPPRLGGMEASMGPEIEFLAPLGGHDGVFMVSHASSGAPQELLECPFWYYNLICPTDPRACKLTGLTEATMLP